MAGAGAIDVLCLAAGAVVEVEAGDEAGVDAGTSGVAGVDVAGVE
jgi:uncharacterized cupin superfamily protein